MSVYIPLDIDLDTWLTILSNNLKWEVLDIVLDILILELASDETFLITSS